MSKPTPQELAVCAAILKRLERGFLLQEIFAQIARLVRLPFVDVIPLRQEKSGIAIGLVKRDEHDQWWPDMWHLPGTCLRSTDTLDSAMKRLSNEELLIKSSSKPTFHGFSIHRSTRGAEIVLVHTIENCVFKKKSTMRWFPIDALPKNFIKSEMNVVRKLKESFDISS